MSKWPVPSAKKEVQASFGIANYYRQFLENYSSKASPLIDLTKDASFRCGYQQQQAFNRLRTECLSATSLTQFDRTFETIIERDASNQAIAGIMSQYHIVNRAKQLQRVA